ncbi:cytochrome b/b6 domain-containing protein [Microbacterium sp. NPDC076911]|uniref:cytochrome b/b6 domain-containing protein n=1 Tax=Microbacterium sp. NPDC076911 TaxID=3154958 RepID=UPI00342B5F43
MATYGQELRRGLPRVAGGEPWPAAADAPAAAEVAEHVAPKAAADAPAAPVASVAHEAPSLPATSPDVPAATSAVAGVGTAATTASVSVRRGLPRTPGGEPWPPASLVSTAPGTSSESAVPSSPADAAVVDPPPAATEAPVSAQPSAPVAATVPASTAGAAIRRGLPRVAGGEPWPPAGFAPSAPAPAAEVADAAAAPRDDEVIAASGPQTGDAEVPVATQPRTATGYDLAAPLPFTRTVWEGRYARTRSASKPEAERFGPFTKMQWAGSVIVGGFALLFAAAMAVFAVRWLLSLEGMQSFMAAYPGEYHLPEGAPVGFPAWLGWQHFFNVFLMVLIIRSGLTVRTEKRPSAFWTPRNNAKGKISLTLWFHQSLDILWLVNGAIFIVLLFVSGQWMRVIPTSWEVFPNALSAALQYVSLDWPTENGWVNYNSLQQIAYFATIFIAAPLAAISGARMSKLWPADAKSLNKAYPIEWARAVHFPVMLYFVAFIFVHVALVLSTGALRNLNHMYAAQGSVDPNAYADNWLGFWLFVASLVVIAAAWVAARPLALAPIARVFGKVSGR